MYFLFHWQFKIDAFICWYVLVSFILLYISFIFSWSLITVFLHWVPSLNLLESLCQTVSIKLISSRVNSYLDSSFCWLPFSTIDFLWLSRLFWARGFRACFPFLRALLDFLFCLQNYDNFGVMTNQVRSLLGGSFFVFPLS